ncbi:MAG: PAS domain-containing protein, partial [Elsteraceae bacterium]
MSFSIIGDDGLPPEADRRLHRMIGYWRSIAGERRFPSRADFDPIDVPQLLPYLTLVDVHPTPPCFVYRLVGTVASEILRKDLTGQPVGAGVKAEELAAVLSRYEMVRDLGAPLYQRTRTQEEENDHTLVDR